MDPKRSIADKYALDYYRRTLPTRSWKSPWNYAALIVAIVLLAGTYLIARNTVFQAAPVSSVHSSFGTNCASCHENSWGGGKRLVALGEHPSVSDATCAKCHPVDDHASLELNLQESSCTTCHQEHRPETSLVAVADIACVSCHRDLQSAPQKQKDDKPAQQRMVSFTNEIQQFEESAGGHPEFAILRHDDNGVGERHAARRLASFDKAEDGTSHWVDRGGLVKFNHALHLDPKQALYPDRKVGAPLTCVTCHVIDTDGYMRPIVYEQHCRKCHPLQLAALQETDPNLPHSSVEEVRGVIRERLARQLQKQSDGKAADAPKSTLVPRLPQLTPLNPSQEQLLTQQMRDADGSIFAPEAKGACRHCHFVEQRGDQWHVLAQAPIEGAKSISTTDDPHPEMIPSRWLPHAQFDHNSHRAVDCTACHQAKTSTKTRDILLPSIAVCRTCHGDDARSSSTHVSADCVLCHTYHNRTHGDFMGVPLNDLFPTAPLD